MADEERERDPAAPRGRSRRRWLTALFGVLAAGVLTAPLLSREPVDPVPHFAANRPAIIAHAGAQGHAPPNTVEAFELALDLGADTLEMDLQLTADDEIVVHHDGTVDDQTDGRGAIRALATEELAELDAGHAFEDDDGEHPFRGQGVRIPTLGEVFDAFPDTFMVLEIKTDGGPDVVEAVAERVRAHGRIGSVAIASSDDAFIDEVRRRLPEVPTAMARQEIRHLFGLQTVGLHRWWEPPGELLQVPEFHNGTHLASHRFVAAATELGVDTHVWTVNERERMHRLLATGAHGIITDHPDRLVDVIDQRAADEPLPGVDRGDVALTEWLQDRLGWLTPVMRAATFVGDEDFAVLGFPLLYWAVSRRAGLRLGVMLLLSAGLNETGKLLSRTPRPSVLDPGLGLVEETSPGVPSGHAQNGVVVWGVLATELRRRWAWITALALVVVLSVSRVHLGVHYPVDVLAGWAMGAVLLLGYLRWRRPVESWLATQRPTTQVQLALAASVTLIALAVAARVAFLDWQPPVAWVGVDADSWPLSLSQAVTSAGALFGLGVGAVLLRARGGFRVAGPVWQRALRCLVGLVGLVVVWQGLAALFPTGEGPIALTYRWLRYATVGTWVAGVAPLLFVRLRLAAQVAKP